VSASRGKKRRDKRTDKQEEEREKRRGKKEEGALGRFLSFIVLHSMEAEGKDLRSRKRKKKKKERMSWRSSFCTYISIPLFH